MLVFTDQSKEASSSTSTSPGGDTYGDSTYRSLVPTKATRSKAQKLIPPLLQYTTRLDYITRPPLLVFPLSPDHYLITLIQYNAYRAALYNMSLLSLLHCLPVECSGSLSMPQLSIEPPKTIPPDLEPTALQRSTPHPFWINIVPAPGMRDNLIRLAGTYNTYDLSLDLSKRIFEGFDSEEQYGCMIWGEPWTVRGWEVSEGFVKKWGFLLKGCPEIIESTNHWREMRGEERLIVEV